MNSFYTNLLISIRPMHWIKNAFVLLPFFFTSTKSVSIFFISLLTAFLFSILSSSVYLLNDLLDIKYDQLHPTKHNRPIARGDLNAQTTLFFIFLFALIAIGCSFIIKYQIALLFTMYWILNLLYSFYLKKVVILDVCCIALGFVIRFITGEIAINSYSSSWILLAIFFLSLFLGFSKRKNELVSVQTTGDARQRKVIANYSNKLLTVLIIISGFLTCLTYLFFANSALSSFNNTLLLKFSAVPVFMGIGRYFYLQKKDGYGDCPTNTLYYDKVLLFVILTWILLILN